MHEAAWGRDDRPVVTESEPVSMSRETTFERDLHAVRDRAELGAIFTDLCERVAEDLQRKGYVGKTIGIKLRYDDFRIATRDQTIDRFTADPKTIRQTAGQCLKRVPLERPLRLLGVRVGALAKAIDWLQVFPLKDFRAPPPDAEFVAIGWGDREFYLNTPTWGDLTASRAFGALSGGNRALVHVSYLRREQLARGAYALPLSQAQYAQLVGYVRAALPQGQATPIAGAHYDNQDAFYEANGGYNLFETCNTWTGRGLRQAGVEVGRWTPFDFTVTWHLRAATP
jgi:uncharacterized protein (TIGR02117 family)